MEYEIYQENKFKNKLVANNIYHKKVTDKKIALKLARNLIYAAIENQETLKNEYDDAKIYVKENDNGIKHRILNFNIELNEIKGVMCHSLDEHLNMQNGE